MATATKSGQNLSFTYNADGLRTTKTVNGVVHTYYYSGSKLVRETYGDYVLDFFYDQNGTPFMLLQNGNIYYYITNAQGDVIRLVDINGNTAASYRYDPYGKAISALGSHATINPLRYRGYVFDHETGLYYLQSRYYDPETGRFINADNYPSTGQGLLGNNMFAYCLNNPVGMSDTSGNIPFFAITAAIGAVVGAVVGGVIAAKSGGNVWAGVGIGAAAGALIGTGAGMAAGVALAGSITASAGAVAAGAGTLATTVSTGGLSAGAAFVSKNISTATGVIPPTAPATTSVSAQPAGTGYNTFAQFKRAVGSPGVGNEWHHVVEQCQIGKTGFTPQTIHNTNNIVAVSKTVHRAISGYYSSIQPFTNGVTVRNYLAGKSFAEQYDFGLSVIEMFK